MISVILPVKNREKDLRRCIKSILIQTYTSFELLVIDDKSEINIKEIIKSFNDDRIFYFRNNNKISNANVCRNIGIKLAKGFYIAMMDSDDIWLKTHLEKRFFFMKSTKADGCFGSVEIRRENQQNSLLISRDFSLDEKFIDYLYSGGFAPTPSHFYLTSSVKTIGFNENYLRFQDLDFSVRFSNKYIFLPCKEVTVIVNWKGSSESKFHVKSVKLFFLDHFSSMSNQTKKRFLMLAISQLNLIDTRQSKLIKNEFLKCYLEKEINIDLNDFLSIKLKKHGVYKILNRIDYIFKSKFRL